MEEKDSGFCIDCGFKVADFEGLTECPQCGSKSIPCLDKENVTVKVNWYELRILGIWAENYAHSIDKKDDVTGKPSDTVYSICERIERQFPDKTPLTLAHELASLSKELRMETNVKGLDKFRE